MIKTKNKKDKGGEDKFFSLLKVSEIFVSEDDLNSEMCKTVIKEAVKIGAIKSENDIDGILKEIWGFNLDLGYEVETKEHRTRFNKICNTKRYVGFERYDEEWYNNPMCSSKMKNLRENIISKSLHDRW